MKKTICILLLMAVALSLAGCTEGKGQTSSITSQAETASVASQKEKEPVTYKLYYSLPMGATQTDALPQGVRMTSATRIPFPGANHSSTESVSNMPKEIRLTLADSTYSLNLGEDYESWGHSSNAVFDARLNLIEYHRREGWTTQMAQFDSTGNELRLFIDFQAMEYRPQKGTFTREMALAAAEALFDDLYGQEERSTYTIDEYYTGQNENNHTVTYRRFIGKYRTEDVVSFEYGYNGDLLCVNAFRKGFLDNLYTKITEADIDAAIQTAENMLGQNLGVDPDVGPILQVDTNGVCYAAGVVDNIVYYINVN